MLRHARENAGEHLKTDRCAFVQADAADFVLEEQLGLVTSTFDSLSLLDSLEALRSCFRCVFSALVPGGVFVFDLYSHRGFWEDWNQSWTSDTEEELILYRSIYSGGEKAHVDDVPLVVELRAAS